MSLQFNVRDFFFRVSHTARHEANVDGRRVVLKFQKADGLWAYDKTEGHVVRKFQNAGGQWEFYIAKELQRRLANAPAIILFFLMFQSM